MPARPTANAYTLVELLIVITVIALLTTGSVIYTRGFARDELLKRAVDNTQSLLRYAQSNASSGFNCGTDKGGHIWSVALKSTSLELSCQKDDGSTNNVRTVDLENNIKINSITGSHSSCTQAMPAANLPVTIDYLPVSGQVEFTPSNSSWDSCIKESSALTVELIHSDEASAKKTIIISKGGAVNAQ